MEPAQRSWAGEDVSHLVAVDSFEDFFELEQDRLLRVLWIVTGSRHEAEDIVQEAFIRVWERWPTVASMNSPAGYLQQVAMNVFRNRYRRAKVALRKVVGAAPPVDAFASVEDRIAVSSALGTLTPRQRAALVLTDLLEYPAEEAGRMLGVGGSTVRSLSSRAREVLREAKEFADE